MCYAKCKNINWLLQLVTSFSTFSTRMWFKIQCFEAESSQPKTVRSHKSVSAFGFRLLAVQSQRNSAFIRQPKAIPAMRTLATHHQKKEEIRREIVYYCGPFKHANLTLAVHNGITVKCRSTPRHLIRLVGQIKNLSRLSYTCSSEPLDLLRCFGYCIVFTSLTDQVNTMENCLSVRC